MQDATWRGELDRHRWIVCIDCEKARSVDEQLLYPFETTLPSACSMST